MTTTSPEMTNHAAGATERYRATRDQILDLNGQYDRAMRVFNWPEFTGPFNWAVDWFDAIAESNDSPALVIVEEDGSASRRSFDDMFRRSNQVAAWLAQQGVGKGDPVIVMLGNQVELWESMLAVMKLGAVLMPTTAAVGSSDLIDRVERAKARHVICNAVDVNKFAEVPGDYTRICVGEAQGWLSFRDAYAVPETCGSRTRARCPRTPCCSTSRPAPRRVRNWSSTPRSPTRSDTSVRPTSLACARETCISTSPRRVGQSMRGRASSRRGSPRPRS